MSSLRAVCGDVEMFNASEVRSMLLEEISIWGSQRAVAKRIGVGCAYLSDVMRCNRAPGPKIAKYFDLEVVTLYRASDAPKP